MKTFLKYFWRHKIGRLKQKQNKTKRKYKNGIDKWYCSKDDHKCRGASSHYVQSTSWNGG